MGSLVTGLSALHHEYLRAALTKCDRQREPNDPATNNDDVPSLHSCIVKEDYDRLRCLVYGVSKSARIRKSARLLSERSSLHRHVDRHRLSDAGIGRQQRDVVASLRGCRACVHRKRGRARRDNRPRVETRSRARNVLQRFDYRYLL